MPLLDYGYDEANRWYYFVYPNLGIRLDKHLARANSPRQVVDYLQQCAELMSKLHSQSMTHGSLGTDSIFYDQESDQIKVYDTSLAELLALIKGEPNTESPRQQQDIDAFKNFMREVWVSSDLSIPVAIEGLLKGSDFKTFQSINKQLQEALWEIEGENNYYLVMTSNCRKKLAQEGFINGPVNWQASNFLQEELKRAVYALADRRKQQDMTYFLITSQMQLLCKRESDYFVIIDIWVDPPARLAQRQERALPIGASFTVVTDKYHISSGRRADIDSFAMEIEAHAKSYSQDRLKGYQDKDRFAIWEEYLEAHQKLLRQFKVRYSSWRQVENEPAIEVELDKELEETFSSEDLFRMNVGKGRMKVIGYYESLTDNVLKIALAAKVNIEDFKQDGQLELDNWQTELLLKRQKRALKRLKYQESVNPNLRSLLTQPQTIEIDPAPAIKSWLQPELDQSQQNAVRRALATRDLFLILGPPGTGKTSTISELALQILARDQQARILITSQSNVAVNHALLQILKLKPELAKRTIRVGREEKTGETNKYQIDRQLRAWGERVAEKSHDYVEQLKAKYSSLEILGELLAILAECEEKSELQQRRRREFASQQEKMARLERDYANLQDALDKTRALRQQAEKLLADAAPQDAQLRQMLRSFQVDYLQWATDFLKRDEQVAEISLE
jgi:guanylate kinase